MAGFIGTVMLGVAVLAQQPPPPDGSQALVQEVRALREAVEQMLAANVRVQLLMGRLQLQEARLVSLSRQASETESRLGNLRQERDGLLLQRRLAERESQATVDAAQREEARQMVAAMDERLKDIDARQNALLADQSGVQQLIVNEQSRWGDFNQRLEELERLLAGARR